MKVSDLRELSVLAEHDAVRSSLCAHNSTGERVVLRTLSLQAATSHDEVALFERERAVLQHLDHPRLPKVLHGERDEVGGDVRLHQVRAYVEGTSLYDEVKSGRHLSEREVLATILGIAETLQYLHSRSPAIVHRDVKPENLIRTQHDALDQSGVTVIDLGALKAGPATGRTIVGTYGYMPPEQYEGRSAPSSDVYALGMTLLFLLTHKAPGDFGDGGARAQLPREAHLSVATRALIETMIAFNPDERPRNGADVARRIQALLDEPKPTAADARRPTADAPRPTEPQAANASSGMPIVVAGVAIGLVALGALAAFFTFATRVPTPSTDGPFTVGPSVPDVRDADPFASGLGDLHADLNCAQRLLPRLLQSEARYLSWVSEGGPTGHERHIYGLYTGYDDAITRCSHNPKLHALAQRVLPLVARAERYYDEEDYKDDAFAQGRTLHPQLLAAFSMFTKRMRISCNASAVR